MSKELITLNTPPTIFPKAREILEQHACLVDLNTERCQVTFPPGTIRSELYRGATSDFFQLTLPDGYQLTGCTTRNLLVYDQMPILLFPEPIPVPQGPPPPPPIPLILIIDDSATVRHIFQTTLQREGYEVQTFPNGLEALDWLMNFEAHKRMPSLIFLDIQMPKMNGHQLARYLKGKPHLAHTPIIMMSRSEGQVEHLKSRLAGAIVYVCKPLTTQQIVAISKQYLSSS